jgi:hypothetical protein
LQKAAQKLWRLWAWGAMLIAPQAQRRKSLFASFSPEKEGLASPALEQLGSR